MAISRPDARGYAGNLGAPFVAHAQATRTALIDLSDAARPREISFHALDDACNAVARGLVRAGLKPGDRIGILSLNRVEFVATLLGAMRAGVVPVPVNIKLATETAHYILNDAGAKFVFVESAYRKLCPADIPVVEYGEAFDQFIDAGDFTPGGGSVHHRPCGCAESLPHDLRLG